ncbi:folate-binding protein [Janibacter limosus]|uniref:CAF17-like 4Fe-4S cluster assembly/insertion protein YgfZ n=1 Tax=Janibacter limosus TaxID=53458 RepID=UPI0035E2C5C5|nr:folate-binding protein [Janibacter limosus]
MTASSLLQAPGAVPGDGIDSGVAAHYGDPMREQRLLSEGLGVVDLSHRGVVTVTGADRLSWLHSLTTQQLAGLAPRTSAESLVLTPKGHVEHALHLVDDGETTWITVEPGTAPALTARLDSMRFMLRVEVADVSDRFAVPGESIDREGGEGEPPTWVDAWPRVVGDTALYGPEPQDHPAHGRRWREVIVPVDEVAAAVGDRELVGPWAAEALRIAARRPRLGAESDHRTIAHEVDWLRTAVHLHKGCYRGQETVARVHNLGRPPRRLAFLHLDGSGHTLPEVGAEVSLGDKVVGRITSVGRHHEDGPIALAMLKRNTDDVADLLVAPDVAAAQTAIVPR